MPPSVRPHAFQSIDLLVLEEVQVPLLKSLLSTFTICHISGEFQLMAARGPVKVLINVGVKIAFMFTTLTEKCPPVLWFFWLIFLQTV